MPLPEIPNVKLPTIKELVEIAVEVVTGENENDPPVVAEAKQRVAAEHKRMVAAGEEASAEFADEVFGMLRGFFPGLGGDGQEPGANQGGGNSSPPSGGTSPFEIPIPVPTFKVVPLEISIPVPSFTAAPLAIPIPIPAFEADPLKIPVPVPQFEVDPLKVPVPVPSFTADPLQIPGFGSLAGASSGFPFAIPDVASMVANSVASVLASVTRDPLLGVIEPALTFWRLQAKFQNIKVMAVSAIGASGCLTGPKFEPLIMNQVAAAALSGTELELATAMAQGVARSFHRWLDAVTVPGLPWYPAFAAFPAAVAPPMPNVPTPLIACASSEVHELLVPSELEAAITEFLPQGLPQPATQQRIELLSGQLAAFFGLWLASQQVMMVLGQGPIPAFAPPNIPFGPVIGGSIISVPGHLAQ